MSTESLAQALHAAERKFWRDAGEAEPYPWDELPEQLRARYRALAAVQGGAAAQSAEEAWERAQRESADPKSPAFGLTWRHGYAAGYTAGAARSEAVVQAALVRVADLERELAQEPPNGTLTRRELLALMDRMTLVDLVRVCGRLGFHVSTTIDGEAHPMPKGVWLSLEDAAMVVDWDIPTGTLFVDENRIKGHIRAALAQSTAEGAS
jgi:hypothetical protein